MATCAPSESGTSAAKVSSPPEAPEPRVRDRRAGDIAKDATSGRALMTIGVVYIEEGESSLIKVTVSEACGLTVAPSHRW